MSILTTKASDTTLDTAFTWLCKCRKHYPTSADIWGLRRHWLEEKVRIRSDLLAGRQRFEPLSRVGLAEGEEVDHWSARDTLVLEAKTIALQAVFPVSRSCVCVIGIDPDRGNTNA